MKTGYEIFYKKVVDGLQNIKTFIGKERKMTPKNIQRIKGMIKNVAKDYNHGKSSDKKLKDFKF